MMKYSKATQTGEFENKLCGCFSDCGSCCYGFCCTPCAIGRAWADVRGEACQCCHIYGGELYIKANIRHARGMEMNYCQDCCVFTCCPICSIVQDLNEIKSIKETNQVADSNEAL
mgnify:CR=1 FL=1